MIEVNFHVMLYNNINLLWFVYDSIQPDHIRVVELPHNGCLFEQFVLVFLLLTVEGLDSHLEWSPWRAHPLSLVDHPKLPLPQLLQQGDALWLQLKRVCTFLMYLSLNSTEGGSWYPILFFLQYICTLELCILLY